ncbi:hypothetical protein MXB_4134 [Myxobolus squamalis]|nr:hypothetical protein MXB_4134 [Myxobolus squamalis]
MHPWLSNKTGNFVVEDFPENLWSLGFLYPFGGCIGAVIASIFVQRYGRKKTSIVFTILSIVGALLKIISKYTHIFVLFAGRFFDGLASGVFIFNISGGLMIAVVLLIFELAPPEIQNIYKSLIQISINIGNTFIDCWRKLESCIYCPSAFFWLRGKYYDQNEVDALKKSLLETIGVTQMSVIQFFWEKKFRLATLALIMISISHQICGINAVVAFAPTLLKNSGVKQGDVGGIIITSLAILGSIIFSPLIVTQRRKFIWITGFVFMLLSFCSYLICNALEAPAWIKLTFLCYFVFIFQIGPGPVAWFISFEMFPPNANGSAQGVSSFFNWMANTSVYLLFPILFESLKYNTLFIFIVLQAMIIIVSVLLMVETKNKCPNKVLSEYEKKSFMMRIFFRQR